MLRWWRRWLTYGRLPLAERGRIVLFAVQLTALRVALRWWPLRRVQQVLTRIPNSRPVTRYEPTHLAYLVYAAAQALPWTANCLHRSVLLWWLLTRRGEPAQLVLGARPTAGSGTPDFHAWVELASVVINDAEDVRSRYAVLGEASPADVAS
jgi:hypothetical protein